jgi:error-prone DNA polymerase
MPGRVVIQWDKEDCADLGIIKVDLLGLGMLAVLEEAIPLVADHEDVKLDLAHLPPDDPAVYQMLCKADTIGVFQVESRAQMATLPRMKPRRFYDLVVEVAIIRPGPIVGQMVNPYLERRNGRQRVTYPHPSLEPILRRTLGVPLFQEQLLRMAMTAAGFSGGEAEELRRAMGFKRSRGRMEKLEQRLRQGMAKNGIIGKAADEIILGITSFALYGFPESHAASFALIAYASAYLKCHHPVAFSAAMLNCYPLGFYHPATLVKDAQRHRVEVRPIDVTRSDWRCTIEQSGSGLALRMGLKYVMGLREETGLRIERERCVQPFSSIADLVRRVAHNRRELDTLAYAGALSAFGKTRRESLWQASAVERDPGSLFAGVDPRPSQSRLPAMTPMEETRADYATTGLTAGPHVMAHIRPRLKARGILSAADLEQARDGSIVQVAGLVIVRQRPGTAKGFFFITLEDETGVSNIIVMPETFHKNRPLLHRAPILLVEGILQKRDGTIGIRGRRFAEIKLDSPLPSPHDFH